MTQTKQNVTAADGDVRGDLSQHNYTRIVPPSAAAVNVLLDAALAYARRGWHVFPCHTPRPGGKCSCSKPDCDHVGKHPRTAHGFLDATTDEATITAWWQKWPDANIGGAAGAKSGFDAADPDGEAGLDDLARLESKHGALPDTPTSITGGGGKHLLFKHEPGKKNTTDADDLEIDLRTTGGYIILPPSLHKSGRRYAWEASAHPDDVPLADMPVWLRAIFPDRGAPPRPAAAATTNGTHGGTQTDIPDGRRNSTLTSKAGSMHRANYSPATITAALWLENVEKCKPPLTRSDVERIVASVTRYPTGSTNGTGPQAPDLPPITYSDLDAPPEDPTEQTILHLAATPRPAAVISGELRALSDWAVCFAVERRQEALVCGIPGAESLPRQPGRALFRRGDTMAVQAYFAPSWRNDMRTLPMVAQPHYNRLQPVATTLQPALSAQPVAQPALYRRNVALTPVQAAAIRAAHDAGASMNQLCRDFYGSKDGATLAAIRAVVNG